MDGADGRMLRALMASAPVAIVAIDDDDRVIYWSPGAEEMFGWTAEEALGGPMPYLRGEAMVQHKGFVSLGKAGGVLTGVEVKRVRRDGVELELNLSARPFYNADGARQGFVAVYQDVTARKKAQREVESWLERAQEIASMGFYDSEFSQWPPVDEGVSHWSKEMFRILGLDPAVTKPGPAAWKQVMPDELREETTAAMEAPREIPWSGVQEYTIRRTDGEMRVLRHHVEFSREEDGRVRIVGAAQDVTEYRQMEERLLQASKLEGIGRLAGGVAHDFNNLLTVINGHADLITRDAGAGERVRESAGAVLAAGRRAAELTHQLLAFSRRQRLDVRPLDVNTVIEELNRMLERVLGSNIEVRWRLGEKLDLVLADPGQMQQVFLNLVMNAKDAMPQGGRLSIETSNVELDEWYGETHPDSAMGPHVCVTISDTGEGMSEEVKARLFEPFFTTKELGRGTGLGLATVYGIVKQSGGFVNVYSEVGCGTTFRVYLPALTVPVKRAAAEEDEEREGERGRATVLLVEDQAEVRGFAATVLRAGGYVVLEAGHGDEALAVAREWDGAIDLMVSDLVMPGMAARELVRRLRETRSEAAVLFISGYTESMAKDRSLVDEGVEVLGKPFSANALLKRVEGALRRGRI